MDTLQPSDQSAYQGPLPKWGGGSRLVRRLLIYILIFSVAFSILSTLVLTYRDYRKDVAGIEARMDQIRTGFVAPLENSLWQYDSAQSTTQVHGILQLPDIAYVEVRTRVGELFVAGSREGIRRSIVREFPLFHGQESQGVLKVVVTLDGAVHRLWNRGLGILLHQMTLVFGVAVFLFVLFSRLLTRHLSTMADYALRLDLNHLDTPLVLDRPRQAGAPQDELDQVVAAFNKMRLSLLDGLNEIRVLNASLESRVEERTAQLVMTSEELLVAKQLAESASRAKSAFLANMSHELRTPMNAILLYSELLEEELQERGMGDAVSDLRKIHGAGKQVLSLIDTILDLSKIDAGRMTVYLEDVPVAELLADLGNTIRPLVLLNRNRFVLDVDPGIRTLRADVKKLRQALLNLLNNAATFTEDGTVSLTVRPDGPDGGQICFCVADSGIGMAPEQLSRLFSDFVQPEETIPRDHPGHGLGLTLTRKFVELMGGRIEVESAVGQGSQFRILLPTPLPVDSPGEAR